MTLLSNYSLSFQFAGIGQRCLAAMVDGLILNLSVIFLIYVSGIDPSAPDEGPRILIFWLMIPWFYFTTMESSSRKGTLGKTMMNIEVTDRDGKQVSFGRAGVRAAVKIGSLGLGFLLVLFSSRRQALHDIVSGSIVTVSTD